MTYWLIKSEPGAWSWEDHVKVGIAEWDGVRNYQAANNMKAMKLGDQAFFYHSVNEKRIVGIVAVEKEYYPDPSDQSNRFGMVDFRAIKPFKKPVTLTVRLSLSLCVFFRNTIHTVAPVVVLAVHYITGRGILRRVLLPALRRVRLGRWKDELFF